MANVELATAYISLVPTMKGAQGKIAQELGGIDADGIGKGLGSRMGGGLVGSMKGLIGPAIAAVAAVGIKDFATEAVASFSELEDSTAAAGVVFGDSMGSIIAQSKTASSTLGLSSQQVISAANTYGTYGKAAGLSGQALADFSSKQTALAADMASFKGTSPEQAIEAIGAALRGETEPIRAYGVMLDDASLKQEAMAQGLIATTKDALTPQAKILAAQALIFKQTGDAQGDFARTSMSTANVAKTLASESENLSAKFGGALAPAFTAARMAAIQGVRGMSAALDTVGPIIATVSTKVISGISGLKSLLIDGDFTGAFRDAFGVEEDSPIVDVLFNIRDAFQSIAPMVGQVFGQIGTVVGPLVPQFLSLFTAVSPLQTIFQSIQPLLPQLLSVFGQLASVVGGTLSTALTTLVPVFIQLQSVFVSVFQQVLATALPVIVQLVTMLGQTFAQLMPIVVPIITMLAGLAVTLISQMMPVFMQLVSTVLPMVVTIFGAVLQAIGPLIGIIAGLLIPIIQALMPVVVTVFGVVANVIGSVMQIVMGIIQVVTGVISGNWEQVWSGIGNIFGGIWNTIVAVVGGAIGIVWSVISSGIGLVMGFVGSALGNIGRFFSDTWNNVVNGVSSMIGNVVGFFSGLIGQITGAIGNAGRALWDTGVNIIQGLIDGIGSMMGAIGRAVLSIVPEAIRGPFEDLLGIHSPSRVFMGYGVNIGQGLINGLDGMHGKIASSVEGMVTVPSAPAFGAGASATAGTAAGNQFPSRLTLMVGGRAFDAYVSEMADQTVQAADAQTQYLRKGR